VLRVPLADFFGIIKCLKFNPSIYFMLTPTDGDNNNFTGLNFSTKLASFFASALKISGVVGWQRHHSHAGLRRSQLSTALDLLWPPQAKSFWGA
jgi:hypothetical protein